MRRTAFLRKPADVSTLTVKLKKCKAPGCRKPFYPAQPFITWCSPDCGSALALAKLAKVREAAAKTVRAQDRAKRTALKTRSDWMKEAQQAFNAYIRARDQAAGVSCICCGEPLDWTGNNVDAGHYRSVGSAPHLRFNEDNCHAQTKKCNRYGAGRAVDYRLGLIARKGLELVEALEADQEPRKYTIPELVAIKAAYRDKLKQYK